MVLRLRVPAPGDWKLAKCLGRVSKDNRDEQGEVLDPWFDENESDQEEAVAFCNGEADGTVCPIREECLLFALTNNEKAGVWGGMGEKDRKALRKLYPWKARQTGNENWTWMPPGEPLKLLKINGKDLDEEDGDD